VKQKIVEELERLGARHQPGELNSWFQPMKVNDEIWFAEPPPTELNGLKVPAGIHEFLFEVEWPQDVTFESNDDAPLWVWLVRFQPYMVLSTEHISVRGVKGRTLLIIGVADGGNYFLLIDLADKNPEDPKIYKIDHYAPEQTLGRGVKLSAFLSSLRPE